MITTQWIEVCDLARLTEVDRAYFWRRQFLNPYALESYRPASSSPWPTTLRPPVGTQCACDQSASDQRWLGAADARRRQNAVVLDELRRRDAKGDPSGGCAILVR